MASYRLTKTRLPIVASEINEDVYSMYMTGPGWHEQLLWVIRTERLATKTILNIEA